MPDRFPRNDIISLTEATPRFDLAESVGPDLRLDELLGGDDLGALPLGYGTAAGDPALRQAVATLHGVHADEVVITVGGMHALFLTAFILCRPGERAVTTAPLFPNTRSTLVAVGADIATLPLTFDGGYRLDPAALRARLTPETRLVSLASPQNPSGVSVPQQTLREVVGLMGDVCPDAYLLVDETYREAAYGDDPVAPSAVHLGPRILSCTSLSKCHGAPGLRLGWVVVRDPAFREQLILGKFNTVISCSRVDEALALRVIERRDAIIGERRRHLAEGLARTEAWVADNGAFIEWVRPDAGALCCIRLKPSAFDAAAVDRFYETLAGTGARVANGTWFGEERRVFRLGFGLLSMPDLEAGLAAVTDALRRTGRAAA